MIGTLFLITMLAIVAVLQEWQLWLQNKRIEALEMSASVPQECQHYQVDNLGTFGAPEWVCSDCGKSVTGDES